MNKSLTIILGIFVFSILLFGVVSANTDWNEGSINTTYTNFSIRINDSQAANFSTSLADFVGNVSLDDQVIFKNGEKVDNILNGWLRLTGGFNVTGDSHFQNILNISKDGTNPILSSLTSTYVNISDNLDVLNNITLGHKITFQNGESLDNFKDGWFTFNGVNVTSNSSGAGYGFFNHLGSNANPIGNSFFNGNLSFTGISNYINDLDNLNNIKFIQPGNGTDFVSKVESCDGINWCYVIAPPVKEGYDVASTIDFNNKTILEVRSNVTKSGSSTLYSISGKSNVVIIGGDYQGSINYAWISAVNSDKIEVKDVSRINTFNSVSFNNVSNFSFTNNNIELIKFAVIFTNSSYGIINFNKVFNVTGGDRGISIRDGSHDIIIENNYDYEGIDSQGTYDTHPEFKVVQRIQVMNNHIGSPSRQIEDDGISVWGTLDSQFIGNNIQNTLEDCIIIRSQQGISSLRNLVQGNKCKNSSIQDGIIIDQGGGAVIGNVLESVGINGSECIRVTNSYKEMNGTIVASNSCINSGRIQALGDSVNALIIGNHLIGTDATNVIVIDSGAINTTVTENYIPDKPSGAYISDSGTGTILGINYYSGGAQLDGNLDATGQNVTASYGLFSFLGSAVNFITNLFVKDINVTGNLTFDNGGYIRNASSLRDYSSEGLILATNLNEHSINGGTILDSSTSNWHGVNSGATFNDTGGYNGRGSFDFDGVNDRISFSNSEDYVANLKELTISAWIKTRSVQPASAYVLRGSSDNIGLAPNTTGNAISFILLEQDGTYVNPGSTHITTDVWHHVVGVYDANQGVSKLFVDGLLKTSDSIPNDKVANASQNLNFGWEGTSTRYFNGSIGEVMIWNRALNDDEVVSIYETRKETPNAYVSQKDIQVNKDGTINVTSLQGTYTNGVASLCVWNNGTIFANETCA